MRTLDHLRWHFALALGGAVLIKWLHWPLATVLIALVFTDRLVAIGRQRAQRLRRPSRRTGPEHAPASEPDREPFIAPPQPARRWLPISLKRTLGADCPFCQGVGCDTCANTGLN